MTATTFMGTALCPAGHQFKIRRLARNEGLQVGTRCKVCGVQFLGIVGGVPARVLNERAGRVPTRESHIEDRLVKRVKEMGGEVRKVKWIGRSGAPDRLVMLPEKTTKPSGGFGGKLLADMSYRPGQTIWVELKAPGKAAKFPSSPHERAQHREHERMRKMGQRVEVIDSYEQIEELLK